MVKFIVRRLLLMIPVILGISFLVFGIMSLTPGDPARTILGADASYEAVLELREEMGLNDNFLVRYVRYMADVLQGDLGTSWRTRYSVAEEVSARIPITLTLAFSSTIFMILFAIPIGIVSAVKQYSWIDNLSLTLSLLLTSMPGFWFGLMLILLFALTLHLLPATGVDTWQGYILPCITASTALMASLIRMTRSSMLEVVRQDYIRTARAKGAGEGQVILRHALRNALLPIITVVGLNFGTLMGGAVISETVFAIPGLGSLLITSVRNQDVPVIMAIVLFIAITIGVVNLVVDILYAYVDPRLKTQFT